MSAVPLHSSASTDQAPLSGASTTSLTRLSAITSTFASTSFSSSSTTQTQPQKKKPPWGPLLNLLLVLAVIILLIFSIVQTWSYIHILLSAQDSSSSSNTSPTTATNSSNSSRMGAAAPQFRGVDLGPMNSDNNEINVGEAKDSHAVITSRPLVVRAVDISPPPPSSSTASAHDSSTVTQPKTKPPPPSQPQPHIPPGPHPEQQQPHTPSPEGTGPKRVSEKKLDGIVAHTVSTHDHPNHHPHDQTSNPDSDQNNEASPIAPRNTVILTICAALGGLASCFCCILGSSRLAICCYYRRRGIVSSNGGVVCVDGPPRRPILKSLFGSSSSSSASPVSPLSPSFGQQPQQQVQMTEFWNVDDPKDSKKLPTSSTTSPTSSKGLFKTLRRQSYTNTISTSLPAKMKKDAPSRLPLAVTAPTAHVISSPVDFISLQHSLDSPSTSSTTLPRGGGGGEGGLDSYYPPYTGGWNHSDFESSTRGSGSGTSTKSKRMPAHSPLPLSLSLPMSLKRNSCQYASSPLSSGLISPCTTMTPSTAGSSSSSEISPFPWSASAPSLQYTDDKSYYSNTGRTMAMSRAQKLQPIDSDTASTLTTPGATTAMMHTSPRTNPRSPLLSPTGHSLSTTPTVPTPPSMLFPRRDGSGANENSGAGSGSIFRGPRSPDHPYDNYYHHAQQQPQRQQQHSYQYSQQLPQNNNSHSSYNSPQASLSHQQPLLYNDNNKVYQQGEYYSP